MSRFHFNVFNTTGDTPDEEGQELVDLPAARAEAIRGIRSLLAAELEDGTIHLRGRIEIADPEGRILETIPFEDAVTIDR